MDTEIQQLIETLDLKAHPEGGYYKETYRSTGYIAQGYLGSQFSGDRHYCTGIYFLLTSKTFSAFHRIQQDEMWHFYKGSTLKLHIISKTGVYSCILIGNNIVKGEQPQYVVPAGDWFAAEVVQPNTYVLAGCTVAPGFDFDDFEMPNRSTLISQFPQHAAIITKLTRSAS